MKALNMITPKSHCADCAAPFPIHPPGYTGGSGYAIVNASGQPRGSGVKVCYACSDKRQREELKDRSGPFVAYVSSDGQQITTWTGGLLMHVTDSRPCKLTRQSSTHDSRSYRSIRARDVHGKYWHGRGSAGIAIKLRPSKR